MTLFGPIRRAFKWALSGSTYDAVQAKNKRSAPTGILRSEDAELTPTDRRKMLSAARTLHRNFAVASWMIRKHLDYVSTFTFQALAARSTPSSPQRSKQRVHASDH